MSKYKSTGQASGSKARGRLQSVRPIPNRAILRGLRVSKHAEAKQLQQAKPEGTPAK